MWHEARRQEKKIRGLMVDYRKRAERRREFYEKIKLDPTQFLRIYGRPVKIHLDPAVATAAEGPQSMQPWLGNTDNMIDRFDVRSNLDHIQEYTEAEPPRLSHEEEVEDRQCNYERYRTLVENELVGLKEEQCLYQIYVDEQFGAIESVGSTEDEKKKLSEKKAAIAFTYEDSTPDEVEVKSQDQKKSRGSKKETNKEDDENNDEDDSDSEDDASGTDVETADLDVSVNVDLLTEEQATMLNECARQYGMQVDDYTELLRKDKEVMEALKMARILEEERAQLSGRKSRRERRAFKERRLLGREISPPSFAARDSPKYEPYRRSSSSSRSISPSRSVERRKVFISSFGAAESDDEYGEKRVVHGPALPSQTPASSTTQHSSKTSTDTCRKRTRKSRTNSRSRSPRRQPARKRSRSYSPRRSNDRRPYRWPSYPRGGRQRRRSSRSYSRSRTRSRSRSRSRRRSRSPSSRQRSLSRRRSRSRQRSNSRGRSRSSDRSRSRSRSRSLSTSKSHSPARSENVFQVKRYRRPSSGSEKSSGSSDLEEMVQKEREREREKTAALIKRSGGPKAVLKLPTATQSKLSAQEKLRKRMQLALSKQCKADKKAEQAKQSRADRERQDRENEMRARMLEMRRREREKRHKDLEEQCKHERENYDGEPLNTSNIDSSGESRSRSRSKSKSHSPISKSQSPVSKTRSPVSKKHSPINKSRSPVSKKRSPINKSRSPVRKSRSPIRKSRSPVRKSRSPVRKSRSPVRKSRSPVRKSRSPVRKSRSPVRKSRSPVRKSRSPVRKSRSPVRKSHTLVKENIKKKSPKQEIKKDNLGSTESRESRNKRARSRSRSRGRNGNRGCRSPPPRQERKDRYRGRSRSRTRSRSWNYSRLVDY